MKPLEPLLIRADASAEMGTGHVMRCMALAQAWMDAGGRAVFLTATKVGALADRLKAESMEVVPLSATAGGNDDARQTVKVARAMGTNWVVVDGYHFSPQYQQTLKQAGLSLLYIDDAGYAGEYFADTVLNQNASASEKLYVNRQPYTQLLLGPRYALLRREFVEWRGWRRPIKPLATNILVTLGGSDPDNMTLTILRASRRLSRSDLAVRVICGPANTHKEALQREMEPADEHFELYESTPKVPELMAWADLVVTAGGSTCWELAFLGAPMLMVVLADNQQAIADVLHTGRIAENLGWHACVSEEAIARELERLMTDAGRRSEMSANGQRLVDGRGASRVVSKMMERR